MANPNPFRYVKTSLEVIRLAVTRKGGSVTGLLMSNNVRQPLTLHWLVNAHLNVCFSETPS